MIPGSPKLLAVTGFVLPAEAKEGINTEHIYENCNLISGIFDQYAHIRNTLKAYGSMAIQEDYTSWKENDFHREVAKLLLIE